MGLNAEEWGWHLRDGKLLPVPTDHPPAPKTLLKIIHCSCKGQCDKNNCSCRKHGLQCSYACRNCKGTTCDNQQTLDFDDEVFDIDVDQY